VFCWRRNLLVKSSVKPKLDSDNTVSSGRKYGDSIGKMKIL